MSTNLQNSIWPNEGGTLGQIKVQIPTGTDNDTIKWPTGDALVHNFVFNEGKLVGFVDTKSLIANSSKTTTFPYEYVNISLPSIADGEMTYNYDQCTYVILNGKVIKGDIPTNDDLGEINYKYMGCKTVDEIKAVDPNYVSNDIIGGIWMESLADLEDASGCRFSFGSSEGGMFRSCTNLTAFFSDLPKLTVGTNMFYYTNLSQFTSDLPKMKKGEYMFYYCKLTSFSSNLSSLEQAYGMFESCEYLNEFTSDLSSLMDGYQMFRYCKLSPVSVQHIADTIKTLTPSEISSSNYGTISIGIGKTYLDAEDETYLQQIRDKGWSVLADCNGYPLPGYYGTAASASITTLEEIGESEMFSPLPYWAKPFNSDEQYARYVDSEGNFYNILGGHYIYVDDPDTYGMFINEDDAAANMRLKKIGEEEIETA